jgi:hypothetical protein
VFCLFSRPLGTGEGSQVLKPQNCSACLYLEDREKPLDWVLSGYDTDNLTAVDSGCRHWGVTHSVHVKGHCYTIRKRVNSPYIYSSSQKLLGWLAHSHQFPVVLKIDKTRFHYWFKFKTTAWWLIHINISNLLPIANIQNYYDSFDSS